MRYALALSGALLGALVTEALASDARAQDEPEVEIVTEPPSRTEPPPTETEPAEPPPRAEPKEPLGHLRVGGGIGFGVGTGFISVAVSPQVSYIFKRIVEPGLSVRYEFSKDRVPDPPITWHTFGGSIFVRLFPIRQLFFLVEGELINTGSKQGDVRSGRNNYGNLLLGGGLLVGVGKGVFVATSLKVPVLRNPFYPDAFPIISAGVGYAF